MTDAEQITGDERFRRYIQRPEEQEIIKAADRVRASRKSRAVLLYGPGGTGKTRLVRQLCQTFEREPGIVWLTPIDVDDSQHWLLSNLERNIARQLDPDGQYFTAYHQYLRELPGVAEQETTTHETVLSYLTRIKAVFEQCYRSYIEDTGATVVMTFDTVEAIRGMYALFTLTQWIKTLPATLFILAGRPPSDDPSARDSIRDELQERHSRIPVSEVRLGEFSAEEAREYFEGSDVAAALAGDEKEKLICLTRGHPLWLAFTIDYLQNVGVPPEVTGSSLDYIRQHLPLGGDLTHAGRTLADDFRRRLVAPYRNTDFWHEAIRRLAVVRESMSQPVWCRLMEDLPWPQDAPDADSAWNKLRQTEWVRPRANDRYVTLHDAVAEELVQRVIALDDPDGRSRHELWSRATSIYADLAEKLDAETAEQRASVTVRLVEFVSARRGEGTWQGTPADEAALISDATAVDGYRQEISHLRSAQVFYQLLSDFAVGAELFVTSLRQASDEHNTFFEDLLAFHMHRFLPGGQHASPLRDAAAATVRWVQLWLHGEGRQTYADVGLAMARFLIDREQLDAALTLLGLLPVDSGDHHRSYLLNYWRGNARMRIPEQVGRARADFEQALAVATESRSADQPRLVAQARNALGFYYRNIGQWEKADAEYGSARDAIAMTLSADSTDADREQMASIQTNWAYLKGIGGNYREGINLVESAVIIRDRIGRRREMAMSLSVLGEVFRYQQAFGKAWAAYARAEQIFTELNNWSWLGQIRQEQAICLFQAHHEGVNLVPGDDPAELAEEKIKNALELCDELNVRAYPSALNRAGRIFGSRDIDSGLNYLMQAAEAARDLSDGWFWFASLIEYAEVCYRAWSDTEAERYLEHISTVADQVALVTRIYGFPELRGRWDVLQGHIGLKKALSAGDDQDLTTAFDNYKRGFPLITHGYVGSYGVSVIPAEIRRFGDLIGKLEPPIRAKWLAELRESWSNEGSSTLLLARLVELY